MLNNILQHNSQWHTIFLFTSTFFKHAFHEYGTRYLVLSEKEQTVTEEPETDLEDQGSIFIDNQVPIQY